MDSQDLGVPVMEIFVRRDSEGRLVRQACVLQQDKAADGDESSNKLLEALGGGNGPIWRPVLPIKLRFACSGVLMCSLPQQAAALGACAGLSTTMRPNSGYEQYLWALPSVAKRWTGCKGTTCG